MSLWNVHSWHWEERPQTQWTKERLPELLTKVEIPVEDGKVTITSVDSIEGDATINVRKGKRIITYELKLKASWRGSYGSGDDVKKGSGKIEMPYICEDVDDHKYQIDVSPDASNEHSNKMKEAILANKEKIYEQFAEWEKELHDKPLQ